MVDARGRAVLPGFVDADVHVPEAGLNEQLCDLEPDLTVTEYVEALDSAFEEQPGLVLDDLGHGIWTTRFRAPLSSVAGCS